jgi:hypothetical protein
MKFLLGTLTGVVATLLFVIGLGMYAQTPHGQMSKCRAMLGADIEQNMQDPLIKALVEEDLARRGKTLDEMINEGCTFLIQQGKRF